MKYKGAFIMESVSLSTINGKFNDPATIDLIVGSSFETSKNDFLNTKKNEKQLPSLSILSLLITECW